MSGAGITEPDSARSAAGGKKARVTEYFAHPDPEVTSIPYAAAVHGALPRNVQALLSAATEHGWAADVLYSRGTTLVKEGERGVLVESCVIRLARRGTRAWGAWWCPVGGKWGFDDAQLRGILSVHRGEIQRAGFPLSAAQLKALVEMPALPWIPCADTLPTGGMGGAEVFPISRVYVLIAEYLAAGKRERDEKKAEAAVRNAERKRDRVEKLRARREKIVEMLGVNAPRLTPQRVEKLSAELDVIDEKLATSASPATHAEE